MVLGQSSFRRILLSRLLLVSIPVLLMGVYVTYRKARSAFLETARTNLTESAIRKGESIHQSIEALETNLVTASDSVVLKLGSAQEKQAFLEQLATTLPAQIYCIQLTDLRTSKLTASTCGNQIITNINSQLWSQKQNHLLTNLDIINVKFPLPAKRPNLDPNKSQLELLLSAPVYDNNRQLHYTLNIQLSLLEKEKFAPGSFAGYPVVINQQGMILAHPISKRVGRNISQEEDAERLKSIIRNAIAGEQNFLHLFALEKDGIELVAGYSSIPSPVTLEKDQKWIILAVSPIDSALAPLKEIQRILLYMMLALFIASILATLYISWELARPVERLRDYALNKENLHSKAKIPQNFKIREFNQLAIAIQEMVNRLQAWGEEIISSWEEAQRANRLKSEFLATTSHELRTPLNGIIGCIRIVKDGYCDNREEELDFLQKADDASVHLLGIINDILDIARIEAGKLSVVIEPVNLATILTEVINLQTVYLQEKNLKLKAPKLQQKIIVNADPAKLKQVLLNVLGNAIKFTESGVILILIKIDEQQVKIRIKDTGIGIAPSQQDKLFRPFVMIDGSTTRKFGGTGLGLAISRTFIELMNGSITLLSPGLGKGTTVEISLPLSHEPTSSPIEEKKAQEKVEEPQ